MIRFILVLFGVLVLFSATGCKVSSLTDLQSTISPMGASEGRMLESSAPTQTDKKKTVKKGKKQAAESTSFGDLKSRYSGDKRNG